MSEATESESLIPNHTAHDRGLSYGSYSLRSISGDEWEALGRLQALAFHRSYSARDFAVFRDTLELDRVLCAYDGPTMVATSAVHTMSLTVPGAVVPAAGVTVCTVHPAHRGQGLLTALMARVHGDLANHGEAVSILWAKEGSIYSRYGYSAACKRARMQIHHHEAMALAESGVPSRLHVGVETATRVQREMANVYEQVRQRRPGYVSTTGAAWRELLHERECKQRTATQLQSVVLHADGSCRGYALYDVVPGDDELIPTGEVRVHEVQALDPEAHRICWKYLLSLALTNRISASNLPIDAPLFSMLPDSRRARIRQADGLWVRLVHLDEALAQRRYAAPVDMVLDVIDTRCPWNAGTWRLSGDYTGATCTRTSEAADVRVDTAVLASAYLGDSALAAQMIAGNIEERRNGALVRLSAAMSWDPRPWCPHRF